MVRFSTLIYFYRKRLRVHAMQELLAGLGIAVGVALVFSSQIANSSITGSSRQILHALAGRADIQVASRGSQGFDDALLARVRALPDVTDAAPLLDQHASLVYGGRRVLIDLVGIDGSLPSLGGFATRRLNLGGLVLRPGIVLPSAIASQLALQAEARANSSLPLVAVDVRGRRTHVSVSAVLDDGTIGSLSGAMLGVVSLPYAQRLTGLRGRISRILVVSAPGREDAVRVALARIGRGRVMIGSVDDEVRSLKQASGPIDQSTGLFAVISAVVGLLFTFTAMLLTVPERRRFVADLRMMGFRRSRVVQILGFQAVVLGACASVVGLLGGYLLSQTAAHDPPGYLAFAFPVGIQRVVGLQLVVYALVGGLLVSCLAAAQPLFDLRRGRAINSVLSERGEPGHAVTPRARGTLAVAGLALLVGAGVLLWLVPAMTIVGIVATGVAMVLAIPATFALVLWLGDGPANRWRLNALALAIRALRATSMRSLALVATGAVAVFGSVGLQGAHQNLLDGLYADYRAYIGTADLWVAHADDDLALQPFADRGLTRRLASVRGVRAVRDYRGGLLDLGDRRVWVIGRPAGDRTMIPTGQVVNGDAALANARLRAGGWISVSQQIADMYGVKPGQTLRLPTPTGGRSYRVAATTTNLGWGPGAIVLNGRDYRRAWASADPSAIEVDLAPGANPVATKTAIRRVLGADSALQVQTTAERSAHADAIASEGLARLGQISTLLLITAALAMAAAMGAGVWQRRAALAQLRIMGWRSAKLWRALLLETSLVLGAGCMAGAVAGTYGHLLGDRWLQLSTGYPAPFAFATGPTIAVCVLVAVAALVVTAIPGYLVSRTPPRLGLGSST